MGVEFSWGQAFQQLIQPDVLLAMALGVLVGIIFGALPGVGAATSLSLLFPLTYGMSTQAGVIMLLSVYCACEYGGSISAILIRTPGTGAAAATVLDGYPLMEKGYPGKALSASLFASTSGGFVSTVVLVLLAPVLASFALKFGPTENFALAIMGLSVIVSLCSENLLKGLISMGIGLLVATIGMDPYMGHPRFIFDQGELMGGINFVPVMIGCFAVAEAFRQMEAPVAEARALKKGVNMAILKLSEFLGLWRTILRSSAIGTIIGILPGAGTSVASFLAYNEEKRASKHPEKFGTGVVEGVAAPEAANNAVVSGAMVPAMALGIPGSPSIALVLALLMMKGIVPGPLMFERSGDLVFLIFAGLFAIQFVMLAMGLLGLQIFSKVALVPKSILGPAILLVALTGSYANANSMLDVIVALCFGILAWLMDKVQMSPVPMVLALILGPMAETNFLKALLLGGPAMFVTRPIAVVLFLIAVFSVVSSLRKERQSRRKAAESDQAM